MSGFRALEYVLEVELQPPLHLRPHGLQSSEVYGKQL